MTFLQSSSGLRPRTETHLREDHHKPNQTEDVQYWSSRLRSSSPYYSSCMSVRTLTWGRQKTVPRNPVFVKRGTVGSPLNIQGYYEPTTETSVTRLLDTGPSNVLVDFSSHWDPRWIKRRSNCHTKTIPTVDILYL